eukprot:TRINITY_DN6179_c0_g1_i1.p1 TRINITY_DN6179_c0_g1~~TRINITY_DN6179_c0_g1_i1.p1  ORF type:complete len:130 (+),score=5.51 TRINITY_DN6179_c0_g1_i1:75-464(+)
MTPSFNRTCHDFKNVILTLSLVNCVAPKYFKYLQNMHIKVITLPNRFRFADAIDLGHSALIMLSPKLPKYFHLDSMEYVLMLIGEKDFPVVSAYASAKDPLAILGFRRNNEIWSVGRYGWEWNDGKFHT